MDNVNLLPHNGEAYLFENFFAEKDADRLFAKLKISVPWRQEPIRIFGKVVMQPRLTCWYGDQGVDYSYSGITMRAQPWSAELNEIKQAIEEKSGVHFTGALLNFYRDGQDSMGWHRDNEKELGLNPVIGSVSFGVTRNFQFRNYRTKDEKFSVALSHGSFLLMRGETQHHWEHQVPKSSKIFGERINLTFRVI